LVAKVTYAEATQVTVNIKDQTRDQQNDGKWPAAAINFKQ